MNMSGIRRQSILRNTRFASASCSASKWVTSGVGCEAITSVCLEESMAHDSGMLMSKQDRATN